MGAKTVRRSTTAILAGLLWSGTAARAATEPIVRRSSVTGEVIFIAAPTGAALLSHTTAAQASVADVLRQYGPFFGLEDPAAQLAADRVRVDTVLSHRHISYAQVYQGIPVFSGVLRLHQDAAGAFIAINGNFRRIPGDLGVMPKVSPDDALKAAREDAPDLRITATAPSLVVVDPGWYGDPPRGARLAYYLEIANAAGNRLRAFFVDARSGEVLDDWSLIHDARVRQVFDGGGGVDQGAPVRAEGDPPVASPVEVNQAYDYAADYYEYLLRAFGYDSINDAGLELVTTVNSTAPNPCPNAFWSPHQKQTYFCEGLVVDDIVAHEFTHGLTQFSANLVYQNQSGQLNEAFSDIFGELVDLYNGDASLVGPPSGEPWPVDHATGPGGDLPNAARTDECFIGFAMRINAPAEIAGRYVAREVQRLGPRLSATGVTAEAALADPITACPAGAALRNPGDIAGKVCVINVDGGCTVVAKAHNCQNAGAVGVIIANVGTGSPADLTGIDNRIGIPLITIAQDDGDLLKSALAQGPVNVTLLANTPGGSARWLVAEDFSGGTARDIWNPRCFFHPESANSVFNTCGESDLGGVHSGNGVLNHAFALVTDGGHFDGVEFAGVGPIKSGAVWFRALTVYLTPASAFPEAFVALHQSALDLIGTFPNDPRTGMPSGEIFTSADAEAIDAVLQAVELDTPGRCGGSDEVLSPAAPPPCPDATPLYSDNFENGAAGWTVSHVGPAGPPTPYDWELRSQSLPFGHPGTAWFIDNPVLGDCDLIDESAVHSLISPEIEIPLDAVAPRLAFTHYMESEGGADGGNVKICIVGGSCQLVPRSAFRFNPYNGRLLTAAQGNSNPNAGQPAWTGAGGGWGASVINLSGLVTPGDRVVLRFEFGKNFCFGVTGWYVDDVKVYDCGDCDGNARADDTELHFAAASDILSNIGTGVPQSFSLTAPPPARGDVRLTVTAHGDFRGTTEFLEVRVNGTVVGTVFTAHASDCRATPDAETLVIPAAAFTDAVGGLNANIELLASPAVDPIPDLCEGVTYVTVFVEYDIESPADADGNGRLDACEVDFDGDGDLDLFDLSLFLPCFTGPSVPIFKTCVGADLNQDDHVDLTDVAIPLGQMTGPR